VINKIITRHIKLQTLHYKTNNNYIQMLSGCATMSTPTATMSIRCIQM